MGTLVCQTCEETIEHFDSNKVTILYTRCPECEKKKKKQK